MKRLLLALLLSVGLVTTLGSCIFVDEHDHCQEGAQRCDGVLVEECVYDDWEVIDDCWDLCRGTCDYDRWGTTICVC